MGKDVEHINKVTLIENIDDISIRQIITDEEFSGVKQIGLSNLLRALNYLSYLIEKQHVFHVDGYGFEDDGTSHLYLLVKEEGEGDYDTYGDPPWYYDLVPLDDELWWALGNWRQLTDGDREFLDAVRQAGVAVFPSSMTKISKAVESAKQASKLLKRIGLKGPEKDFPTKKDI